MIQTAHETEKMPIGWREWAALPELNIPAIKVKVDTGALTSAIHAFNIRRHEQQDNLIQFEIHPIQKRKVSISCVAPLVDVRSVKSSNGQRENRYVIRTPIRIGSSTWAIDITLTNRDLMTYRMLLGRSAMDQLIIDPNHSYRQGKMSKKKLSQFYDLA